jgi:hypothetical protein
MMMITRMSRGFLRPPRRDGAALGFGLAFVVFGVLGLLRVAGLGIRIAWVYAAILIGIGGAGLASLVPRERS